jgi:hypothetical protein
LQVLAGEQPRPIAVGNNGIRFFLKKHLDSGQFAGKFAINGA